MKTKDDYNQLLISGLKGFEDDCFSSIPENEKIDHTFSKRYLKKKHRLLKQLDRSYWCIINTTSKRAAVLVLSFVFVVCSLVTADSLIERRLGFTYKVYSTFAETVPEENPERKFIETTYTTNAIPSFFTENSMKSTSDSTDTTWKNAEGYYISLTQYTPEISLSFNSENAELSETSVNKTPCLVCKSEYDYMCIWKFDGYMFMLDYPASLGDDFMKEIIGKLVPYEAE